MIAWICLGRGRWLALSAALLGAALALSGCGRAEPVAPPEVGACDPDESGRRDPGGRNMVVQQHDFGVVRPKQECKHTFEVANTTGTAWTFAGFQISCSCTVANLSAPVIPPGESARVEVTYKALSVVADDRRNVGVVFKEPGSPLICLEISARIRDELSLAPGRIQLIRACQGRKLTARFEIQNYAKQKFAPPRVNCTESWVVVGPVQDGDLSEDEQTQTWRVGLTVDTTKLTPGNHAAIVVVLGGADGKFRCELPVELYVVPAVSVVPEQLFFGDVPAKSTKERTALLQVNDPAVHVAAEDLTFEHDLGDTLRVEPRVMGQQISLRATYVAGTAKGDGVVRGRLLVRFKSQPALTVTVPVMARVVDEAQK